MSWRTLPHTIRNNKRTIAAKQQTPVFSLLQKAWTLLIFPASYPPEKYIDKIISKAGNSCISNISPVFCQMSPAEFQAASAHFQLRPQDFQEI